LDFFLSELPVFSYHVQSFTLQSIGCS